MRSGSGRDNSAKVSKWKTTVPRRGQIRIPVELRKKYGIRRGTTMEVLEDPAGLMLKPIPRKEHLAGADASEYSCTEIVKELDKLRRRWR